MHVDAMLPKTARLHRCIIVLSFGEDISKKSVSLHILSFICFSVIGTSDETLALVFDILHLIFISQPLVKIRAILTNETQMAKISVMVKQLIRSTLKRE